MSAEIYRQEIDSGDLGRKCRVMFKQPPDYTGLFREEDCGDREKISGVGYSFGSGKVSGKTYGTALCVNLSGHKDKEKQQ